MARHYFVTGGAGFIGSHVIERLLATGHRVTAYDDLSTGFLEFLTDAKKNSAFRVIKGSVLDQKTMSGAMAGCDFVFHLAANADVRFGIEHPRKDL